MKKTVIGGLIMLAGVITTMTIILTASLYVPSISSWSGSKLWFAIFGSKQYGNEVVDSLFLGVPFVIGVVLTIGGLVLLVIEYFTDEPS